MLPSQIEELTPAQLDALVGEAGYILYLRDRATLRYHWSKLPQEAREEMAKAPTNTEPDAITQMAMQRFYADYGLPEFEFKRALTGRARHDLARAIEAGRVPGWVLLLLDPEDVDM